MWSNGDFVCFVCAIFLNYLKKKFRNTIRVSNSLGSDQASQFVRPDMGPNCLSTLSAGDKSSLTSRERAKRSTVSCRFSRDVETIDNNLPQNFRMFLNTFFGAVSVFVVISYSTPLFLTIILPMAILYYLVQVSIAQYSTVPF